MDKLNAKMIEDILTKWLHGAAENFVPESAALEPALTGLRIYDDPIVGVCAADDEVLQSYRDNEKANLRMIMPDEWLPGAKSVISVFLPLTARIRESNYTGDTVSFEWLHGRIEGQACVVAMAGHLTEYLNGLDAAGGLPDSLFEKVSDDSSCGPPKGDSPGDDSSIDSSVGPSVDSSGEGTTSPVALAPTLDSRFKTEMNRDNDRTRRFSSNWSERHVAYAAGLGTFSMPGGIITRKGTAGRLLSVVTTLDIVTTPREYTGLYQYCIECGACERRCPAHAINTDMTKNAVLCSKQLDLPKEKYAPYYGCGKCQTSVPCEYSAPGR